MTTCPKCGYTSISEPFYVSPNSWMSAFGQESLRYTCERCGYFEDRPTDDQKKAAAPNEAK